MTDTARRLVLIVLATLFIAAGADVALAQESATVTLPTSVSFTVSNVSAASAGSPATTRAAFSNATLLPDRLVRISVRAETATFDSAGNTFPASLISWTIAGANNGTGLAGSVSATSWTPVFEGYVNSTQGAADLTWTLSAPGRTRAGTHTLALRWKIESVTP